MVEFDRNGNPQPPGIVNIDFAEFKLIFVDSFDNSETRKLIFNHYENYISDFKQQITFQFDQWLNGSYTTKKENPSDIDLVNLVGVSEDLNLKKNDIRKFLTLGGSKDKYMVDGYFIPVYDKNDPRYLITEHWLNHWTDFFGHDRLRRAKTLFEISYS